MPSKPKVQDQQQAVIPFAIEGHTANRDTVRKLSTNTDWLRKIDISLIKIRPDHFNARKKPEGMSEEMWEHVIMIPDLADGIFANNGPTDPPLGDFHSDGHFYLTNGERRTRAIRHLVATERETYPDGTPVATVLVLMNPPGTTDLQRKKRMYEANNNLPFTPMQKAYHFASYKDAPYEFTHEQIAKECNVSRQTVDNYVLATTLPADIQEKIDKGEINISNALHELRKEKAAKKKQESGDDDPILTAGQEYHKDEEQKKKDKLRGDEDEFDQQDNSVTGASSMGGPKGQGSESHVVGKDSIYMNDQKKALWRQFLNRHDVLKTQITMALARNESVLETTGGDIDGYIHNELANRLINEYNLTVK